jgi:uroporphyrinogen-III synthase
MNAPAPNVPDLHGWTVITLRSASQNAALRRQISASGARFIGLPALQLRAMTDPSDARAQLAAALACPQCIFTSPVAVEFADRLHPLQEYRGLALAVGSGSAEALRRAGVKRIAFPAQGMHSEGLLALQELNPPAPELGLVTAPGGRGLIAAALADRGASVHVAHVYQRTGGRLDRRHSTALLASPGPLALLLSSAEALSHTLGQLPAAAAARLRMAAVVAPSERLLELAGRSGFRRRILAASPAITDLLAAVARHANGSPFR